jgi:membrane protein YqaA with SNARE-associated domain
MLLTHHYAWWGLVIVASLGNILGSVVNWLLGRGLARFEDRRWFPVKREQIARGEAWYHAYGRWSLREPFPVFLALVSIAKTARYVAVAAITNEWF